MKMPDPTSEHSRRVRVILKQGYKYEGEIVAQTDDHLTIHDDVLDSAVIISRDSIMIIEQRNGGTTPWQSTQKK